MSLWLKFGALAIVLAMIGGMIWSYESTMKENGELRTKLDAATLSIGALTLRAEASEAKQTDLAKLVASHTDALAATAASLAKKQAYAVKTYQGASDAVRSVLDTDLPQFRCLYEAGGCEAGPVPDQTK